MRGRWVREFGCEVVGAQALRFPFVPQDKQECLRH